MFSLQWPIINSRVFRTFEYIDRLASCCSRASARLLHALCPVTNTTTTTDSPHIQAQPRASSRSRPASSAACPARRAALSQTPVVVVVVAIRTLLQVQRCVHLPRPTIYYRPAIGHAYRACVVVGSLSRSSLARLASTGPSLPVFTHARRDLAPTSAWLATPGSPAAAPSPRTSISVLFAVATSRTLQLFARARNSV